MDVYDDYLGSDLSKEYQSQPQDRLKRVCLSRAKELLELEKPIFIYENNRFKRIPSVGIYYTKNKYIFVELKNLYATK